MPIYMDYKGVTGDVTESKHTKWIEVNSFQFGVGRGISSPTGASSERESSAPSVSEITVTKEQDVASVGLLTAAYQGDGVDVKFDFCRTNKDAMDVYMSIALTNTMISGFSMSSGGDRPSESLSLNFTKIEYKSVQMAADGSGSTSPSITYDIGQAKTV